jgi:hypothetical protein
LPLHFFFLSQGLAWVFFIRWGENPQNKNFSHRSRILPHQKWITFLSLASFHT